MKKIASILLASTISVSAVLPVFAEDTFSDVNGDYAWAYDYVEEMAEKGLVKGYDDGTYRPGNSVSRMEAFALFARLMGSNSEINKDVLEIAKNKYAGVLKKYDLSYAEGDVAFMLMKGVITESELDTYFKGTKKSSAMPRNEAAILITKAMAAEKTATEEVLIDMDYTDVTDIPKDARQYVYYVSQAGIMSGMGNGTFSPMTEVNRGQIAVMLSKTVDKMNYWFESVKIVGVDAELKNIEIQDADGKKATLGYSDDTSFTYLGDECEASEIPAGTQAVFTYCEKDGKTVVAFADIVTAEPDEVINATFKGYSTAKGAIKITVADPISGQTKNYDCSPNAKITIDGIEKTVDKIKDNSYLTIGILDGSVISIESMQSSEEIDNAIITDIDLIGTITISHKNDTYDGLTLPISGDVKVYKNGDVSELAKLYKGDAVKLVVEYGVVSKITATSLSKTINGTLKEYTISATPSVTIKSNGEELAYEIPANIIIVINGEKGGKLTDIEIGANIKLSVESNVVTRLEAIDSTGLTVSSSIKGVVTAVNPTANVVIINYQEEGVDTQMYISCTSSTKVLVQPSFSESALKHIKVNDVVEAYGTYSNGIFVCSTITYNPSK